MKLIKACIAMAALAALSVVPSLAQGVVLTHHTGTVAPVGTLIEAKNVAHTNTTTQTVFTTSIGNVTCTSATLTGVVTKNKEGVGQGEITTANFAGTIFTSTTGHCSGNFIMGEKVTLTPSHTSDEDKSLPWCVTANNAKDEFFVKGGACGGVARPVTFTIHGNLTCTYEAAEIRGTYTTHPADAIGTISAQEVERSANSSSFCPPNGTLDMAFTIFTDGKPNEPFYLDS